MFDEQALQGAPHRVGVRQEQAVVLDGGVVDGPSEREEVLDVDVVPEVCVRRVQWGVELPGPRQRPLDAWVLEVDGGVVLHGDDIGAGLLELLHPPLRRVGGGRQRMVVLDELAVVDEVLSQVEHRLDAVSNRHRLVGVVDSADVAVGESHRRPLDGVDGDHAGGLARSLGLQLSAGGEEVIDQSHRRGVNASGSVAVVACPPVAQAEAAGLGGVAEHRTARDEVTEVLTARFDARRTVVRGVVVAVLVVLVGVVLADGAVDEVLEPGPLYLRQFAGVPLDLRRLQGDPLGENEAHTAARVVRVHPFEVAVAGDLLVAGGLAV